MNIIYINDGDRAVYFNEKKNYAEILKPEGYGIIDWMYIVPQDCEVRYKTADGTTVVKNAEKGDILMQFYKDRAIHPVAIIKNKELKENFNKALYENNKKNNEPCPCENCGCCAKY